MPILVVEATILVIPKGDNKWEKVKLICIGGSKNMSELTGMVGGTAYMSRMTDFGNVK